MEALKNRKIGLIWSNPYSTNLGVAALAYSALVIFEEVAKIKELKFEYFLWGGNRKNDTLILNGNSVRFRCRPAYFGGSKVRILKNIIRRPWTFINYKYVSELKDCDFLADIGEGDSYSDIYGIERFRHFNYVKRACQSSGNPYLLLPQTIGPFYSDEAKSKAKTSLESIDFVMVRDRQSYDYCVLNAPHCNVLESIDMAFFLPYEKVIDDNHLKIRVGINISGLLWEGGYTRNNQFELKDDYKKVVTQILDYLNNRKDIEVHLIGHVIGNYSIDNIDEDMHIINIISNNYPSFIVAPTFKSPVDAKSYIASMDFFAGARMHSCIASISSGIPVFPMAYSRKFNGLFSETLNYSVLGDLRTKDASEILSLFESALENRISLSNEISVIRQTIIEPSKKIMIDTITSLIK